MECLVFSFSLGLGLSSGLQRTSTSGHRFRVEGLGFRVWGLGFRVCGLLPQGGEIHGSSESAKKSRGPIFSRHLGTMLGDSSLATPKGAAAGSAAQQSLPWSR